MAKEDIEYRYKRMRALFIEKMFRDGSIDEKRRERGIQLLTVREEWDC